MTEIIMIAITPMPPTISATDEMTTSANDGAADLIPQAQDGVLPPISKSFGSSSLRPWRIA